MTRNERELALSVQFLHSKHMTHWSQILRSLMEIVVQCLPFGCLKITTNTSEIGPITQVFLHFRPKQRSLLRVDGEGGGGGLVPSSPTLPQSLFCYAFLTRHNVKVPKVVCS